MLNLKNKITTLLFSVLFLANCSAQNNQDIMLVNSKDKQSSISQAFSETLATGCVTSNLIRNKFPDNSILDRNKYVIPFSAPQALGMKISTIPGQNKVVLANKKFPQNIYVASSDVGLCNIFLVNAWDQEIPTVLNNFFNLDKWEKKEAPFVENMVSNTYVLRSGGMTGVYSYEKGLKSDSIGINTFVTFGLTK